MSIVPVATIVCDWPECGESVDLERGEKATAARARAVSLGWCNNGCGRDYCPQHRAMSGEAPRVRVGARA